MLAAVARHRVSVVVALPMMYRAMLEHPAFPATDLSSVRMCIYGMAPLPKTLLLKLQQAFCPDFALCSGQTEMYQRRPSSNRRSSAGASARTGASARWPTGRRDG